MKIVQGHVAIIMGYGLVVDTFYAWKCRSIVLFSKCTPFVRGGKIQKWKTIGVRDLSTP